jgi:prepilin-type processing-associated H-X9-DG protein
LDANYFAAKNLCFICAYLWLKILRPPFAFFARPSGQAGKVACFIWRNGLEPAVNGSNSMANYFIIGGDGKEYGPVTDVDVRQWVTAGRIHAQSLTKSESDAEFRPLSTFPEFADAFAPRVTGAGTPPPLPVASPAKTSGLAITSLILGILGLFTCGATALIGLILGIIAMTKVKSSGGKLGGNGIALAGIIVSAIFLFMIPIFAALLLPALAAAKQKAQQTNCMNNEKQLALAVKIYASDNTNCYPPAATWCDAIHTLIGSEKAMQCPAANPPSRCDYAYNARLDGLDESKVNPITVMFFESDAGWNAHGGPELVSINPRHGRGTKKSYVVAFADGHVEVVPAARLNSLRWDP